MLGGRLREPGQPPSPGSPGLTKASHLALNPQPVKVPKAAGHHSGGSDLSPKPLLLYDSVPLGCGSGQKGKPRTQGTGRISDMAGYPGKGTGPG